MAARKIILCSTLGLLLACHVVYAVIFGDIRGVVHDPDHRPIAGAQVVIKAVASDWSKAAQTNGDGEFEFSSVPLGEYRITVAMDGFAPMEQLLTLTSDAAPVLHLQLKLAATQQSVEVSEAAEQVTTDTATPTTMIARSEIDRTPGASLTNSFAMITNFVPGAYVTHDQLHVRGGHQVTWEIDGIAIPNTNIASNVGPQIDPKDIDYLESQRGGYSADSGDRTYGVFNVVPRTGFEKDREMEVNAIYGTLHQTNDQINLGDHTQRFAYFASVNGNRSDWGLEPPGPAILHDRVWGLGAFGSLIFNKDANNQFRFVTSVRSDDYQIPNDQPAVDAGIRDVERERDFLADFTWNHVVSPGLTFTISPFVHFNRANYDGDPNDTPVSTTQHLDSTYGGAQMSLNAVIGKHNAKIGVYGFGQHDDELIHLMANDGSGAALLEQDLSSGHLEALFLEDQFKVTPWLALSGGVRFTHFSGGVSENAASPRIGASIRIPRVHWTLRGFFGNYYQAPPLTTVSGPVIGFAVSQGLGFVPLHGERDQENQVGLTIPLKGWALDVNNFRQRAVNFFDHNNIGESNLFFPLSIAGARIWGTEFTLRSPRIHRRGEIAIIYSNQHAQGEGAITGGLTDFSAPANGWFNLDHDQRHTFHANFNWILPRNAWVAGGWYYGSGFSDGNNPIPNSHLPHHSTIDLSLGKSFREKWTVSISALNAANRRFLLDNSTTFGGTHYAEPRQIYVQVRYRFHY